MAKAGQEITLLNLKEVKNVLKNKFIVCGLCVLLIFSFCGCEAGKDIAETASPSGVSQQAPSSKPEINSTPESVESEPEEETVPEIPYPLQMFFLSGVGAWSTEITLNADGSFSGYYHDSEMGGIGKDYPNGTVYECKFSGQFSELRPVNDYTFALTLQSLEMEGETGQTRIEDGVRYEISYPYGLMNSDNTSHARDFLFYTPDAPVEELREEFLSWWPEYLNSEALDKLMLYGLCNTETDEGFFTVSMN